MDMRQGTYPARWLLLALPALIAGCGGSGVRPPQALPPAAARPAPPVQIGVTPQPRPQPQVLQLPGLGEVIGANAAKLLRDFGDPRLDYFEGDVRKLQFSGTPCVLDIYLYPPQSGGEPVATHLDARRGSDGQEVDRAACVQALRKR